MVAPATWFAYLNEARWFQAKGLATGVAGIEPGPWLVRQPDCWLRSELAEVTLPRGSQTYHLIVGYLPAGRGEADALVTREDVVGFGPADVVDAPRSAVARQALWRGLTASPAVTWWGHPPDPATRVDLFTGEQSNTNLAIGDAAVAKLLRKLTEGRSLDVEVLAALNGSGITPGLLGAWRDPDRDLDLGLVVERIPDAVDGWDWATQACREGRPVGAELAALGRTLRRLHELLARAFPTHSLPGAAVADQLRRRLDHVVAELPQLRADRLGLDRAVAGIGDGPVAVQRVHGDFHLGQTLLSGSTWTILDFEGEPLKTPAERRAPDSRWRDVAGLTRSIDYARGHHPHPDSAPARAWAVDARRHFLDGYAGGDPVPGLLGAYEADKAAYELLYETRNRPQWRDIPRRALADLARAAPVDRQTTA